MKTQLLQVRVSPRMKRAVFKSAAWHGVSVSEYVRSLLAEYNHAAARADRKEEKK